MRSFASLQKRDLDRLGLRAAQFCQWRFRWARLDPRASLLRGPYGVMDPARRRLRDVLLIAAGVGVTTMRSTAEAVLAEPAGELAVGPVNPGQRRRNVDRVGVGRRRTGQLVQDEKAGRVADRRAELRDRASIFECSARPLAG